MARETLASKLNRQQYNKRPQGVSQHHKGRIVKASLVREVREIYSCVALLYYFMVLSKDKVACRELKKNKSPFLKIKLPVLNKEGQLLKKKR